MALVDIQVPDIGDFDEVGVIELLVKPGDTVKAEQSLLTVESDKASMEIPSSHAGTVKEVKVALGDKVKQGSVKRQQLAIQERLHRRLPPHRRPQPQRLPPPARWKCACPTLATSRTWPSSSCWSR
jgi:hypothetical protein